MAHGGYRRPANPAPVSGPGKYSRRTDGQPVADLPNAAYGEQTAFAESQRLAPVPQAPDLPSPPSIRPEPPRVVGLGEPTGEPDTPVTAGASYGAGPGPEALGLLNPDETDARDLNKYMPFLIRLAERSETPRSVKRMVRRLLINSG